MENSKKPYAAEYVPHNIAFCNKQLSKKEIKEKNSNFCILECWYSVLATNVSRYSHVWTLMGSLNFCGTGSQSLRCFSSCFCITRSRKINSGASATRQEGDCTLQVSEEGKYTTKRQGFSLFVSKIEQVLSYLGFFSTAFWQPLQP